MKNTKYNFKFIFRKFLFCLIIIIILWFVIFLIDEIKRTDLSCLCVDEQNGNIALSYLDDDGYNMVQVFNKNGDLLFKKRIDDRGGELHHMFFDMNNLHIQLGRKKYEYIYDLSGNIISSNPYEQPQIHFWEEWDKKGTSYQKKVELYTYYYDYSNLFELFLNPTDVVSIETPEGNIIVIWSN